MLPHPRQNSVPAGKILKRNCLRLEAKFDGLIIIDPLLDLDEIIRPRWTTHVKSSAGQTIQGKDSLLWIDACLPIKTEYRFSLFCISIARLLIIAYPQIRIVNQEVCHNFYSLV